MARPEPLSQGQITPAARPVDAFLRPVDIQVAAPGRPVDLPNLPQASVISTGGTPNVEGANSFQELAEALRPFAKEAVQAAATGGLMYASWRMDQGQAQATEAVRRAQAANDQSTEAGQLEYAAANRALSVKDPKAGWLMHTLDPYTQMGWERGKAKAAGAEIEAGMMGYVARNSDKIDYTAPDQGFGALQRLRAEYISSVTEKYGITDASHGFQKYAAPSIEKASDRVAQAINEDRVKYFDERKPKELSGLLKSMIMNASQTGTIEYKGRTFTAASDGELFYLAVGQKLNDEAQAFLRQAGLGGQASKWSREAYEILRAEVDFNDNPIMASWLSKIQSTEPLRDSKGKPVMVNGQVTYLSWEELYSKETLDSKIRYEQAGYTSRAATAKDIGERGTAAIVQATEDLMPGPERYEVGLGALNEFLTAEEKRLGRKLTPQEKLEVRKGWKAANELNSDLVFERDDPRVEVNYFGQLATLNGTSFNAAKEREKVRALAATIRDPKRAAQFLTRAMGEIEGKEKEVQDFSAYAPVRDKVVNDNIRSRLERNYDARAESSKPDRVESERRQRLAYTTQINAAIRAKEAQLKRKLTENEVRALAQDTIDTYGTKDKDALEYLYPGSAAYPGSPSVDPYTTQKPTQMGADGKPKPDNAQPIPKVYEIGGLDSIPNRRQVLVEYENQPVLSLNAIRQSMFKAIAGKPLPPAMERAWRDAGAPNAFTFLERQLEHYPDYKRDEWTPEELEKAKKRLSSSAALESKGVAQAALAPVLPRLVSLANWAGNTALGIGPASAATEGGGGSRPFTGSGKADHFKGVLALLRSGEGGWDSANRGTAGDTRGGVPGLSRMTLNQWRNLQASGYFALGAYQFIPKTLQLAARELGLSGSTVMTPEVQGQLAVQLMIGSKRPRLAAYLSGKNDNIGAALDDLALEWASVHTRGGGSAYAGIGGNAASISRSRAEQALRQARLAYLGR